MSDLPPNGLDAGWKGARPEPRLQWGNPDCMFFDIIGHLWWNLEVESDPDHPKSICFKAQDICRVLPDWEEYVRGLPEDGRPDLSVLAHDYRELMKQAEDSLAVLSPLLVAGVERSELARAEYRKLHSLARSTYERRPTKPAPAGVKTAAAVRPV
jgi:hypothetical protein